MPKEPRTSEGSGPRKPEFTEENFDTLETAANLGLTFEDCAALLGYSAAQFYRLSKEIPQLYKRFKKGRAEGNGSVAAKLRERIQNNDTTAMIFYLKTRGGWKEKFEINHGGTIKLSPTLTLLQKVQNNPALLDKVNDTLGIIDAEFFEADDVTEALPAASK